jgi:hypothetical protein
MRSIDRRIGKLESRYEVNSRPPKLGLRLIVTRIWDQGAEPTSTCQRYVRDGSLTEIVRLNGEDSGLSGDELERFIASFPVEAAAG